MKRTTSLLWHYTTGEKFRRIAQDGVLLTEDDTTERIEGLPGAVWFSMRKDFEPTARKLIRDEDGGLRCATLEETRLHGGGLVRIGVSRLSPFLLTWQQYRKACSGHEQTLRNLEDIAIEQGSNVNLFRASLGPVPLEKWAAVEVEQAGAWVPVEFERNA